MGMGRKINRDIVHGKGEVRSMIQIEPAQEILVGLAVARVLGHHHPRYGLQQFAPAQKRQVLQIRFPDGSFRRRGRLPQQVFGPAFHHHFRQFCGFA